MAIPDNEDFRELLSGLRLSERPSATDEPSIQVPSIPAVDERGSVRTREFWLHYTSGTKVSFRSFCKRINKELTSHQHLKHGDFAIFVLAFYTLVPETYGNAVARLNAILSRVCKADVTLYYIMNMDFPEQWRFEIPPFSIGPLRAEKLRYNSERADSDYYTRYRDVLSGCWAIEREPFGVGIFDFPSIQNELFYPKLGLQIPRLELPYKVGALADRYFSLCNQALFADFLDELVTAQSVLLALGAPYFDVRTIEMLSGVLRTHRVAVFLNIGAERKGFVAPGGVGSLSIDLAGINERVPLALEELRGTYGIDRFDNTPLHISIKLFSDFVARARRHEVDGHMNEALLHYVIALELIFADRQSIQATVAKRVAIITFSETSCTFERQQKFIENIYETRSRYVHAGKSITDVEQLDGLGEICQRVFRCLLRLQAAFREPADRTEGVLKNWLSELDYLIAGLAANKNPSDQQLRELHVSID